MNRHLAEKRGSLAAWFFVACLLAPYASAQDPAQLLVHLLDYISADYSGAVQGGGVTDPEEYEEMTQFSAQVKEGVERLPRLSQASVLTAEAADLASLVARKAEPRLVAERANQIRWRIIEAYGLTVAPRFPPDMRSAPALYAQRCASCHGVQGRGDGLAAGSLAPRPADFQDLDRMAGRSLYGLYNSISLGVAGTAMPAFNGLSEQERWVLAFYVAGLGVPAERLERGEALWRASDPVGTVFPDLKMLATLSPNEASGRYGGNAALVQDYLRAHPEALAQSRPRPIALARRALVDSLAAYERGNAKAALELATSAYLDGFELAESALDNVDRALRLEIEKEMLALRGVLRNDESLDGVQARMRHIDTLLERAEQKMSGDGLSEAGTFVSACVILLREGLEAILLLAAIITFVARTGRRNAMPWIHAGWIAALGLGALTWFAAEHLIDVSGANREVTEGMSALLASGMLLYVGFWLHGKSQSRAWSQFVRNKVGAALEQRTLWALAALSFLAVYRELFEVVLFYQALWSQASAQGHGPLLGGVAAALLLLSLAGWGVFKSSLRLPLGPFFLAMLWLMLLFAFVFAGDGIAKLQEAGTVTASPVRFPTIAVLGIHPTAETLGVQLAVVALIAIGYWVSRRKSYTSARTAR